MLKRILFSFACMLTAVVVSPGVAQAVVSSPFSTVTATASNTDRGEFADHAVTFTTTETLASGEDFFFMYLAGQVDPATTGINFTGISFTETEDDFAATMAVPGPTYIAQFTLTQELPAGTYSFTFEDLTNPDSDVTVFASITEDDEIGQNSNFVSDETGLIFGEGTIEDDQEGSDQGECQEIAVPELDIDSFAFGEYVYVSWDEAEGADTYVVSYSMNSNLSDPVTVEAGLTDMQYIVGPLDTETEYYMVVRADDENRCNVGVGSQSVVTEVKELENQRTKKAEFTMPKKKRKKAKFNIKPNLGEELAVVQRLEYQVFKGKKIKKADRIGKKVRKQKNKNLGNAITVKGKNVEAGTYYWIRVRKVYTIGDDVITTKYSKKKRIKTAGEKAVAGM